MKILLCAISDQRKESSLNFAVGLLKLQPDVLRTPELNMNIFFSCDINDTLNAFYRSDNDQAIFINTMLNFDTKFVERCIRLSQEFIAGIYPLKTVNWDRIKEKVLQGESREHISHMGNEYSINTNHIKDIYNDTKLVKCDMIRNLDMFGIQKSVLEKIVKKYGDEIKYTDDKGNVHYHFWADKIVNGKCLCKEENFVRMYGEDVYADLETKNGNFGSMNFQGCVGYRRNIR